MGITQGLLAAMVANTAPADLRGTAYGFFNLISGFAMLVASGAAGLAWDRFGASFTFYAGALFCGIALMGLVLQSPDGAGAAINYSTSKGIALTTQPYTTRFLCPRRFYSADAIHQHISNDRRRVFRHRRLSGLWCRRNTSVCA